MANKAHMSRVSSYHQATIIFFGLAIKALIFKKWVSTTKRIQVRILMY